MDVGLGHGISVPRVGANVAVVMAVGAGACNTTVSVGTGSAVTMPTGAGHGIVVLRAAANVAVAMAVGVGAWRLNWTVGAGSAVAIPVGVGACRLMANAVAGVAVLIATGVGQMRSVPPPVMLSVGASAEIVIAVADGDASDMASDGADTAVTIATGVGHARLVPAATSTTRSISTGVSASTRRLVAVSLGYPELPILAAIGYALLPTMNIPSLYPEVVVPAKLTIWIHASAGTAGNPRAA